MAYCLDLWRSAALSGVNNVFHVSLLRGWLTNGVHANVPSIEIDGKAEYEVSEIKGHHEYLSTQHSAMNPNNKTYSQYVQ